MKPLLVIASLLAAAPTFGQPRVYTNADLGRPLSPNRVTVTPEQLASLEAHQFRLPMTYDGPTVVSSGSSPTGGPFGEFQTIAPRRLDGSLLADPPWESISYYPPYYGRSAYIPAYTPYVPYQVRPRGVGEHGGRRPAAEHGASRPPSRRR